jgi:hypothetical protein
MRRSACGRLPCLKGWSYTRGTGPGRGYTAYPSLLLILLLRIHELLSIPLLYLDLLLEIPP